MRTFKNNDELKALIVDGTITINDDIHCPFAIDVNANITAYNITAYNITALNITALNITAHDISYYAFCMVYKTLRLKSIKGRRENSIHVCLDSEIEIINPKRTITIDGKSIEISEESFQAFKEQFNK